MVYQTQWSQIMDHSFPQNNLPHFPRARGLPMLHHLLTIPKSNGKAVKTLKRLLKKSMSRVNLSIWHFYTGVTLTQKVLEPVQLSVFWATVARHCFQQQDLDSNHPSQLQQMYRHAPNSDNINNKHAKALKPIAAGEIVRMRLAGSTTWCMGTCKDLVAPSSNKVKVGERIYRCNRRQLIEASESYVYV